MRLIPPMACKLMRYRTSAILRPLKALIIKKTFSILLIASFIAYAGFLRFNGKSDEALPVGVIGKTTRPPGNSDIALNNQTPASNANAPQKTSAPETKTPQPAADPYAGLQAQGKVRIVNDSSNAIKLIKTTRLATSDGKIFRLGADVTVAA